MLEDVRNDDGVAVNVLLINLSAHRYKIISVTFSQQQNSLFISFLLFSFSKITVVHKSDKISLDFLLVLWMER